MIQCVHPMKLRALLMVAVAFTALSTASASEDKAGAIDQLMASYHELGQFNGTVLVAEQGEVVFKKGYGMANMEWAIPNDSDTKFRLGSITKQFTAMLVMQLVEEGKLSLDATVADLLPDYRKDTGARVTVHQLLTHTSGIPSYTGLPGFFADVSRDPYTVEEFVTTYCSGELEFEPGSAWRYNNSGYFLLGAIIEQVTGEPYEQVLATRILEPLGMDSTGYDRHATVLERRAAGYERGPDGFRNAPYLDMGLPYAAGSMYSTVEDLYLWDQALYGDKLLSAEGKQRMFEPVMEDYAYGWALREAPIGPGDATRTLVAHGGGINGFNTLIARIVDDRHLVVLLNNTGGARLQDMQNGIFDLLYGREPQPPKTSVADALTATVAAQGVEAAIADYRRLKEEHADEYDFGEGELNRLGYGLLESGNVAAAIEIFKLNVEMFPEGSNPYDSLAEAYMAAGDKELAIVNYAKSLALNTRNLNAVRQLARLAGVDE